MFRLMLIKPNAEWAVVHLFTLTVVIAGATTCPSIEHTGNLWFMSIRWYGECGI